jgi:hypothetical protein
MTAYPPLAAATTTIAGGCLISGGQYPHGPTLTLLAMVMNPDLSFPENGFSGMARDFC